MSKLSLPAEGFARPAQVAHAFGVSRATLYNWIKGGSFPGPQKHGERISVWPVEIVREHIKALNRGAHPDNPPTPAS